MSPTRQSPGARRLQGRLQADFLSAYSIGEHVLYGGTEGLPPAETNRRITRLDLLAQQRLPCPDGTFDSLVALDVLFCVPDWKRALSEWARVVVPGGRLLFDGRSLDHQLAAPQSPLGEADDGGRIAAADLVAEADRLDLAVGAVLPHGAFLGGDNHLLGGLPEKRFWSRLLSWLLTDEAFFQFALFLEQELVAHLTTTVTGRFWAVLEKRRDPAANRAWLERNRALDLALQKVPIDRDCLASRLGMGPEPWRRRAAGYLEGSLRSRRLLECLAAPLVEKGRLAWSDLVAAPFDSYFCDLDKKREEDRIATELSQLVPCAVGSVARSLDRDGVPLGEGLEYLLVERLLQRGLGRFTGNRS